MVIDSLLSQYYSTLKYGVEHFTVHMQAATEMVLAHTVLYFISFNRELAQPLGCSVIQLGEFDRINIKPYRF